MNPVNTIQCNVMMEREGCNTLPAKLNPKEGTVETYWEPTVEERAALSYGANVRLSVMGMTIPPVMLDVSYVGENGPVLFYKDTLEKVKLAEKLDEAIEHASRLRADLEELARRYQECREIAECPNEVNLNKHVGGLVQSKAILMKIREISECPRGKSLIEHIESMMETIELLSREDDEDDPDIDDDEDDEDDDDWWKRKQAGEEE